MAAAVVAGAKVPRPPGVRMRACSPPPGRTRRVGRGQDRRRHLLEDFSFTPQDLDYLRRTQDYGEDTLRAFAGLRFTGEVRAVPEGRVVFAGEPLLEVTAPIAEAQLAETMLLNPCDVPDQCGHQGGTVCAGGTARRTGPGSHARSRRRRRAGRPSPAQRRSAAVASVQIPLGDAPVPGRGGQPCPAGIAPHQAVHRRDRPARHSRQAARRRADHPRPPRLRAALVPPATAAPGHRPLVSLQHPADHRQEGVTIVDRKEVTECNTIRQPGHHVERQPGHAPGNRDCSTRRALRLLHARESLRSRRYRPGGPYPPPPGVSITNRSPAATATESLPRIGVTEPSACSTQCRPSAPGWPPAIP